MLKKFPGILSIAKSTNSKSDELGHVFSKTTPGSLGWDLPGQGSKYHDCGEFFTLGCLNIKGHTQEGLFEKRAGMVFIKRIKRTCARAECPVCHGSWAGKQAEKISWRIKQWKVKGKPIHVVVSVPEKLWFEDFKNLRRLAYKWVKKANFWGGSVIWHPFRQTDDGRWYFSPHFHMIGYGWIRNTSKIFKDSGWIIKNVGVRDSVGATAYYQLTHAGIHLKYHTVTWFGSLSYNKLRCDPLPKKDSDVCPLCDRELVRVFWVGEGVDPLPDVEMGFYIDPGGWIEYSQHL